MTDRLSGRLVSPPARASARKRANTDAETRRETIAASEPTDGKPARDPPLQENAPKAHQSEKPTVIIPANEFSLLKVLRYLEAGKIVLIIPATGIPEHPP